jgi:hypothetical protein
MDNKAKVNVNELVKKLANGLSRSIKRQSHELENYKNNTDTQDYEIVIENPFELKKLHYPSKDTLLAAVKTVLDNQEKYNKNDLHQIVSDVANFYDTFAKFYATNEFSEIMRSLINENKNNNKVKEIVDVFDKVALEKGTNTYLSDVFYFNKDFRQQIYENIEIFSINKNEFNFDDKTKTSIDAYKYIKKLIDTPYAAFSETEFVKHYQILKSYNYLDDFLMKELSNKISPDIVSELTPIYDELIIQQIKYNSISQRNSSISKLVKDVLLDEFFKHDVEQKQSFVAKLENLIEDNRISKYDLIDLYDSIRNGNIANKEDIEISLINDNEQTEKALFNKQVFFKQFLKYLLSGNLSKIENIEFAKNFYNELEGHDDFYEILINYSGFESPKTEDSYDIGTTRIMLPLVKNPSDEIIIKALNKYKLNVAGLFNENDNEEQIKHKQDLLNDYIRKNKYDFDFGVLYLQDWTIGQKNLDNLKFIRENLPTDIKAMIIENYGKSNNIINLGLIDIKENEFYNQNIINAIYQNTNILQKIDSHNLYYQFDPNSLESQEENLTWTQKLLNRDKGLGYGDSSISALDDEYQKTFIIYLQQDMFNQYKQFNMNHAQELLKHIELKYLDDKFIETLIITDNIKLLDIINKKFQEDEFGNITYFELNEQQQRQIIEKDIELIKQISNPSYETLITTTKLAIEQEKDIVEVLGKHIHQLQEFDYQNNNRNHYIDEIVKLDVDYAIHFVNQVKRFKLTDDINKLQHQVIVSYIEQCKQNNEQPQYIEHKANRMFKFWNEYHMMKANQENKQQDNLTNSSLKI